MKTTVKPGINTPIAFLIFSTLYLASGLLHAATPCDIETEQVSYASGETVRLSVMRLTNSEPVAQFYEWKLWLKSPDLEDLSLVNLGADSSVVLPAGFDVDFASLIGPVELFTIDNILFPSGNYEIGCRLVNPITGAEYADADVINFVVP